MSSEARQESAKERIILATYTLAAEGMNIRDLDSILLATPMSNIEQAVGRIFRLLKEERTFVPLIWDVNDVSLPCLAGQLKKRNAFYKKCDYTFMFKRGDTWTSGKAIVAELEDEVGVGEGEGEGGEGEEEDEEEDVPLFSTKNPRV